MRRANPDSSTWLWVGLGAAALYLWFESQTSVLTSVGALPTYAQIMAGLANGTYSSVTDSGGNIIAWQITGSATPSSPQAPFFLIPIGTQSVVSDSATTAAIQSLLTPVAQPTNIVTTTPVVSTTVAVAPGTIPTPGMPMINGTPMGRGWRHHGPPAAAPGGGGNFWMQQPRHLQLATSSGGAGQQ